MTPKRIQVRRVKGWRKPANTVYVGRPSKWGNPFRMGADLGRAACVDHFREWVLGKRQLDLRPPSIEQIQGELRGMNLACWCKVGEPCHGDILLEIANA